MSPSKTRTEKKTRSAASDGEECGSGTEVLAAMEQLIAYKKAPAYLESLISHMFNVQNRLCLILVKNQELQEQLTFLPNENTTWPCSG